jgi:hypothetical protein
MAKDKGKFGKGKKMSLDDFINSPKLPEPCKTKGAPAPKPCKTKNAPAPKPCKTEGTPAPKPCKTEGTPAPKPCKLEDAQVHGDPKNKVRSPEEQAERDKRRRNKKAYNNPWIRQFVLKILAWDPCPTVGIDGRCMYPFTLDRANVMMGEEYPLKNIEHLLHNRTVEETNTVFTMIYFVSCRTALCDQLEADSCYGQSDNKKRLIRDIEALYKQFTESEIPDTQHPHPNMDIVNAWIADKKVCDDAVAKAVAEAPTVMNSITEAHWTAMMKHELDDSDDRNDDDYMLLLTDFITRLNKLGDLSGLADSIYARVELLEICYAKELDHYKDKKLT